METTIKKTFESVEELLESNEEEEHTVSKNLAQYSARCRELANTLFDLANRCALFGIEESILETTEKIDGTKRVRLQNHWQTFPG